jgi:hypothetical protein
MSGGDYSEAMHLYERWNTLGKQKEEIEMTFTDEQIEAAMQAGRTAVYGDYEGCEIRGYPPIEWCGPSNECKPLADAWRRGWDEENAKLAEADFVKFTPPGGLCHVIANASHLSRCYRYHMVMMVHYLAEEYGWQGQAVEAICEHCSGGGRRYSPECARNFAAALGRALEDGLARLEVVRSTMRKEIETMHIDRRIEHIWEEAELLLKYQNLTPENIENVAREMMETAAAGEFVIRRRPPHPVEALAAADRRQVPVGKPNGVDTYPSGPKWRSAPWAGSL